MGCPVVLQTLQCGTRLLVLVYHSTDGRRQKTDRDDCTILSTYDVFKSALLILLWVCKRVLLLLDSSARTEYNDAIAEDALNKS